MRFIHHSSPSGGLAFSPSAHSVTLPWDPNPIHPLIIIALTSAAAATWMMINGDDDEDDEGEFFFLPYFKVVAGVVYRW